jgi:hypothetical protein
VCVFGGASLSIECCHFADLDTDMDCSLDMVGFFSKDSLLVKTGTGICEDEGSVHHSVRFSIVICLAGWRCWLGPRATKVVCLHGHGSVQGPDWCTGAEVGWQTSEKAVSGPSDFLHHRSAQQSDFIVSRSVDEGKKLRTYHAPSSVISLFFNWKALVSSHAHKSISLYI